MSDNLLAKYLASLDSEEPIPTAALLLRTRLMIQLGNWDVAMETVLLAAESDHKNADVWALKVINYYLAKFHEMKLKR